MRRALEPWNLKAAGVTSRVPARRYPAHVDLQTTHSIPNCTHRPTCPGCPHFGVAGLAPSTLERIERLADETGAALAPVLEAPPHAHRHRARLMVRGRARSPKVGLFQAGTHRIADIPGCPVHHPLVNST
jgi:tRNA/tmRNA/rRNA uracil-C5-methylase (TrmA/RlmC/RlmD family)